MKKINIFLILILSIVNISSCKFQPNNSHGISLQKITEDTLRVNILDSYYRIKDFSVYMQKDTFFVNIDRIYKPDDQINDIFISIPINAEYIKLQNDKVYHRDSIPWAKAIYLLGIKKDEMINRIQTFKNNSPKYKYTEIIDSISHEKNDQIKGNDKEFYFYIPEIDIVFVGYSGPSNYNPEGTSLLEFEHILTKDRKRKRINTKDLSKEENSEYKKIFENEILNSLDINWKRI